MFAEIITESSDTPVIFQSLPHINHSHHQIFRIIITAEKREANL